ncbi:MAG TPA: hypothetical protein ENJ51_12935 [Leucothrix mucor]|uniref:Nicotinamide riboside transporter PnuC n=1 Tax=Leucothrix mucor TaxID=45248 RepID=A0A7V2T231_LEUMU|nr:hypothetical protein [Leucothrix mucor]
MKKLFFTKNQHSISALNIMEWSGAMIAVVAAIMLALNVSISPWAFVLYFISSLILAVWGWYSGAYAIALQNVIFIGINSLGIYRWLIIAQ